MNYYEELGVGPDATEQEIRKAHRRLVKLMHPDAQPDQSLKMLAETQMRRLNSIVSTLLDPEQRRSYDEELQASNTIQQKQPLLPSFRGIPWWLASAVGAVVLSLVVVWLWADHMSNSGRSRVYTSSQERSTVSAVPPEHREATPEPGNEIGSASYKLPAAAPPAATNDGISTAVVPDLPPEAKTIAKAPPVQPRAEDVKKLTPPAVVLPDVKQQVKVALKPEPKPEVKPEVKKVSALPPKAPENKPDSKPQSPPVTKPTTIVSAKAAVPDASQKSSPPPVAPPKKVFTLPAESVIARTSPPAKSGQLPSPPNVAGQASRDYGSANLPAASLPAAAPPKLAVVTTTANPGSILMNPRDPLEGEWVYAPKEPEKRKAGFYPPEFIDLKLFGSGDPGNLKGQYSAKYVVTDRPVSPEVTFELASVAKGSRRFVWQSTSGAKGTLNIDPIDERTIRIDWHTTSAVSGPALTSGTATLVRRQ